MRARLSAALLLLLCGGGLWAPAGASAQTLRLPLPHLGSFTEPRGLAFDQAENQVYAIDGRSEIQQVTVSASSGKFKLKFGAAETGELEFDIKEGPLETAMRSAFCGGGPCVSVTGGPGDAIGSKPFVVRFQASLATTDVEQLTCISLGLTGGSGCSVQTSTNGVNGTITRYNADGTPAPFSALGSNQIDGRGGADKVEPGAEGLRFGVPRRAQVAVDESGGATNGDIYVSQNFDHAVDIFGPSGAFLGRVSEFEEGPTGSGPLKAMAEPCGAAVDSAANLYVGEISEEDLIHKYHPAANPVASTDTVANFNSLLGESSPCTLAAGAGPTKGFLFADRSNEELFKLDATTGKVQYGGNPISTGNTTVTVDPVSGHVLTASHNEVQEWDAAGASAATPLGSISAGSIVNGVAVNGSTGSVGTVYLSRTGVTHLDVYGPLVEMPVVAVKAPIEVSGVGARLQGTISADGGPPASCHFEYLKRATYLKQREEAEEAAEPMTKAEIVEAAFAGAASAACEPPGTFSGSSVNEVSGKAEPLESETEYEFRLVGTNANGALPGGLPGGELSFETLGKPQVRGGTASHVSATSAQIDAEVNPRGSDTSFTVQYVTEQQFEESEFGAASTASGPTVPASVSGKGDLSAATGTGTLAKGFSQITGLTATTGTFTAGQTIEGAGIPTGTTITSVSGTGTLGLSRPAQESLGATGKGDLSEGSQTITGAKVASGAFAVGLAISGPKIPTGTTILAVEETSLGVFKLTISKAVEAGGSATEAQLSAGVALSAGSKAITNLATTAGRFAPGQTIEAAGIPAGTTIVSVGPGELTISKAPTQAGTGVALSASGFQPVRAQITGLLPETAYRFRAVAENESGSEAEASAHAFTTRVVAGPPLLDERAYEMVTPAQKAGEPYVPESEPRLGLGGTCVLCTPGFDRERMPMQATADGNAIAFEGDPFEGDLAPAANEYVAKRGPGGWQTSGLSTPAYRDDTESGAGFKAFSADLSRAVVLQAEPALTPQAPEGFANLYLQEAGKELQTAISKEPEHRSPGNGGANAFHINYAGANAGSEESEPFSHVIFQANDSLTLEDPGIAPEAPEVKAEERDLYEWSGGQLHLVSVLPGNGAAAPDAVFGSGELLRAGLGREDFDFSHAISNDGSRIFWTAVPSGQLYVREGGIETTEIPDHTGRFLTATPSGSKVLLSDGMLYDLEDETFTDLTEVGGVHEGGFLGIAGTSEDLTRIYFLDSNELGGEGEVGEPNLYLWEEGEVPHEGTLSFIATLLASDNQAGGSGGLGAWHAAPSDRLAQVTPDGGFLAFESRAPLTGYENAIRGGGPCAGVSGLGTPQCFEVFEYDAQTQTLSCPSCNPSGEAPLGSANLSLLRSAGHEFFGVPQNLPPAGEGRIFFESRDALTQADANGAIQDVYEWEPEGVGSCTRAGGCLALISNGRSPKDSHFLTADAKGDNAFFVTRERLVRADKDDFLDVYDARVGGGFEEGPSAPCAGEACAGAIPSPPGFEAPSSSQAEGEGPVRTPSCRRGYVRRGTRCVRKHHVKRHRHHHRAAKRRGGRR